eukprot:365383-Chlamydomonas_euryale.AAC.15
MRLLQLILLWYPLLLVRLRPRLLLLLHDVHDVRGSMQAARRAVSKRPEACGRTPRGALVQAISHCWQASKSECGSGTRLDGGSPGWLLGPRGDCCALGRQRDGSAASLTATCAHHTRSSLKPSTLRRGVNIGGASTVQPSGYSTKGLPPQHRCVHATPLRPVHPSPVRCARAGSPRFYDRLLYAERSSRSSAPPSQAHPAPAAQHQQRRRRQQQRRRQTIAPAIHGQRVPAGDITMVNNDTVSHAWPMRRRGHPCGAGA